MKKNISLLILIAIFSQLNAMEHKRKLDDFIKSDNQKGNSYTKKNRVYNSDQAMVLPELTILPELLGMPDEIKLLILENNIRNIIDNNNINGIFDSIAKVSKFILHDISLLHSNFQNLSTSLLHYAKKYLKQHYALNIAHMVHHNNQFVTMIQNMSGGAHEQVTEKIAAALIVSGIDYNLLPIKSRHDSNNILSIFEILAGLGYTKLINVIKFYNITSQTANDDLDIECAIITAIKNNHTNTAKSLINYPNININYKNHERLDALATAALKGNFGIFSILIKNKNINLNARYRLDKITILMAAIIGGNHDIIKLLLENDSIDINAQNTRGETALSIANLENNIEIVKMLLEKNVNPNLKNLDGVTVLMKAASENNINFVKALLEEKTDINIADNDGNTVLMHVAKNGHKDIVKLLIDAGADINAKNKDDDTALMTAIRWGQQNIVELLIDSGANVNLKDNNDDTALMFAAECENTNAVKLLINAKANIDATNNIGDTALIMAVKVGCLDIVELLIKSGANINAQNKHDNTPLLRATKTEDIDMVQLLIMAGADVNKTGKSNRTALMISCFKCNTDIFKMLLDNGADITIKDINHKTIEDYALECGYIEVAKLIDDKISQEQEIKF